MKIKFNCADELLDGIGLVSGDLGIEMTDGRADLDITVTEADSLTLSAEISGKTAKITYGGGRAVFFRALATVVAWAKDGKPLAKVTENPIFTLNGAMVDMSRNAVMNVKTVKFMMRKMALMGLNAFMLYTEDTYEIEGRPYFGYMRGRYTKEELRELDSYALKLGIELIPCIQMLGHLSSHLRWEAASSYKDTQNVMLVGADATYKMIDDMLKTVKECFTSKRIHIGMDETHDLGCGAYLNKNGYTPRRELYLEHLDRVVEMVKGYGLSPMMWSDMIVYLAGENLEKRRVYDTRTEFSEEFKKCVPEGVQMVFWDYYNKDEYFYAKNIENHQKHLCENTMFAGGIWTWSGFGPLFNRSLPFTIPALDACRKGGVREVIATIWHNGAENLLITSLAGLAWYASYGYKGYHDMDSAKECFRVATGEYYDDFAMLEAPEEPHGEPTGLSRAILYNDPMIPLADKNLENLPMHDYYVKTTKALEGIKVAEEFAPAFEVMTRLSSLFEDKAEFGLKLKAAYDKGDREALEELMNECDGIAEKVNALRVSHRKAWMTYNKPFGWEVFDLRYGAIIMRFDTCKVRLGEYLAGDIDELPELEAERLRIDCSDDPSKIYNLIWKQHTAFVSAARL